MGGIPAQAIQAASILDRISAEFRLVRKTTSTQRQVLFAVAQKLFRPNLTFNKDETEARKRERAEQKKREREMQARRSRVADLEGRIAEHEQAIRDLETEMSAPGFYENREAAQRVVDRHQALMWEVGELMHQWESLSELLEADGGPAA